MRSHKRTIVAISKKRRKEWPQYCPFSYDYACCFRPSFIKYYVTQASSITSNLEPMLMLKETDQIVMRKALTRYTVPPVASSRSPVALGTGSRETPFVSHLSTDNQNWPQRNQHRAALAIWDRCESSPLRCNPDVRRRARLFFSISMVWALNTSQSLLCY